MDPPTLNPQGAPSLTKSALLKNPNDASTTNENGAAADFATSADAGDKWISNERDLATEWTVIEKVNDAGEANVAAELNTSGKATDGGDGGDVPVQQTTKELTASDVVVFLVRLYLATVTVISSESGRSWIPYLGLFTFLLCMAHALSGLPMGKKKQEGLALVGLIFYFTLIFCYGRLIWDCVVEGPDDPLLGEWPSTTIPHTTGSFSTTPVITWEFDGALHSYLAEWPSITTPHTTGSFSTSPVITWNLPCPLATGCRRGCFRRPEEHLRNP